MFNRFSPVELEDRFDSGFSYWDEFVFPEIHRERSMSQSTDPATRNKIAEELRPANFDYSHQDSLFTNSVSSRAYFVVHPEWTSEMVDPPVSKPLNRPPWPWEQPRYRQNIQRLHAYKNGQNGNENEDQNGNESENSNGFKAEDLPYSVPSSYKVTHPPEPRLGY